MRKVRALTGEIFYFNSVFWWGERPRELAVHKGEDLDIPTYLRRGVPLN